MEIQGRLIQICAPITGEGRNGQWKRQDFVIETQTQYPRKVCFTVNGDKIDVSGLQEGQDITVSINIESREYNGRYFTDIRAWRITQGTTQHTTSVDVQGKIIKALDPKSGTGKNGKEWKMQEFVLETQEQYPRQICFAVWGDRMDKSALQLNELVTVSVDVDSRQGSNGNWFTSVQAYKALKGLVNNNVTAMPNDSAYGVQAPTTNADPLGAVTPQPITPDQINQNEEGSDLPF